MNPNYGYSMLKTSLKALASAAVFVTLTFTIAEANPIHDTSITGKPAAKPFKILTAGKRITVKSDQDIAKIMVWTSSGHRFVEENNVNAAYYSFDVTIREHYFFMLLEMKDGKRYTQKFGVQ
jgi:hypothetical protein